MQEREEKEKIVNYGLIHIVDNDRDIKTIFNKKAYETEFLAFYDIYSQGLARLQFALRDEQQAGGICAGSGFKNHGV